MERREKGRRKKEEGRRGRRGSVKREECKVGNKSQQTGNGGDRTEDRKGARKEGERR